MLKHALVSAVAALAAAGFLAAGCTRTSGAPPGKTQAAARPESSVASRPLLLAAPRPSPVAHISPPRPAPPIVVTPMPGEPDARALSEVRLVDASCKDAQEAARRQAAARIQAMNAEIDARYQQWKQAQAGCREQRRWQARQNRGYSLGYGRGSGRLGGGSYPKSVGAVSAAPAPPGSPMESAGMMGLMKKADGPANDSTPARAARSASGTNTQVAGVDEADIVKNDGRYVYLAMNGALRILEAMRPRVLSVMKLPGSVRELFVEGDRAVVYVAYGGDGRAPCTYGYDCQFAGDGSSTKILVLDIADRERPRITRQVDLSGSLMAARRIGRAVHTVVADMAERRPGYSQWPPDLSMCGTSPGAARVKFEQLKAENAKKLLGSIALPVIRDQGVERPLCENLLETPLDDGEAYTTIASFDLADDRSPVTTTTLQSRPGAVFASAGALYFSTVHRRQGSPGAQGGRRFYSFYPTVDEVSDIHKFRIGERAAETRYVGSGSVPGHVLNQFAMDEYYGYLRIATTRGKVPDPKVESAVSILAETEGSLVRVGAVQGLAPGEDIRAVRFDGDRGYVVTFKKTDPLFVLDLYQPAHPEVLGELKIPGFSTYMHRIDPDHLLSIGFDANDHGSFAYFDGVILQLFDVTVPTQPKLLHKEKIGTRGSSSEALTNHLAFNYFAEKGLLAIPMTVCEGGGDGSFGDRLAFSGLLVYGVNVDSGFSRLGGIDHGTHGASCNSWWSNANSQVKRSIFLDDLVYSIATDRLKVQRMGHFGEDLADIALMP